MTTVLALTAPVAAGRAEDRAGAIGRELAALERRHGGRLGVAIIDAAGGRRIGYRGSEPFPLCSTFKVLAAAFVLARVDHGSDSLSRRITYPKSAVLPYAPVTAPHAGEAAGLTLGALCEAAVVYSDNTAANLMLDSYGGPAELTAFLSRNGDDVTRLDRNEPTLNTAIPGDPRDTTTPLTMAASLRKLVLGTTLAPASRDRLAAWLVGCRTGATQLRAGAPKSWRVGGKTGSGGYDATNDVAVLWPPDRPPIVVTAYYVGAPVPIDERRAVLASVGRLAATA